MRWMVQSRMGFWGVRAEGMWSEKERARRRFSESLISRGAEGKSTGSAETRHASGRQIRTSAPRTGAANVVLRVRRSRRVSCRGRKDLRRTLGRSQHFDMTS